MSSPDALLAQPWWSVAVQVLAHLAVLLVLPPFLLGVISRVKAWFAGRRGPPLLQLYRDLAKLWRKGAVFSTTTTWVFRLGPVAGVVTAVLAGLIVPLGMAAPVSFTGDLILVAYLFALGRFATILSALDTGSAFEGMGASREAAFSCLAEPALFLGLVALARLADPGVGTSLVAVLGASGTGWAHAAGAMGMVLAAWCVVLLVENSRIPFDDPNTHLELTMVHEVMVLDHSGPPLALVLYGAAVKFAVIGALVLALVLPRMDSPWAGLGVAVAGLVALAAAVGVVESVMARVRLLRVPLLLVAASLLAGFGVIMIVR